MPATAAGAAVTSTPPADMAAPPPVPTALVFKPFPMSLGVGIVIVTIRIRVIRIVIIWGGGYIAIAIKIFRRIVPLVTGIGGAAC